VAAKEAAAREAAAQAQAAALEVARQPVPSMIRHILVLLFWVYRFFCSFLSFNGFPMVVQCNVSGREKASNRTVKVATVYARLGTIWNAIAFLPE